MKTHTYTYYYSFKLNGIEDLTLVVAKAPSQARAKLRDKFERKGDVTDLNLLTGDEYRAKLDEKIREQTKHVPA